MKIKSLLVAMAAVSFLAACSDDDNDNDVVETPDDTPVVETPVEVAFDVTVLNLTAGQPFSPIAAIVANSDYSIFTLTEAASVELEYLAEGGQTSFLIDAATEAYATAAGDAPFGPGSTQTVSLRFTEEELASAYLNAVTMLVNTNDAITAAQGIDLSAMEVGDSYTVRTASYDAGTEANTEGSGTMPGPADGGEGFNATRDDTDQVLAHPGVITADDGLTTSRLSAVHRWDNPVAQIMVTRTE